MNWAEWQILATDYWSQWMTAFVAVCLTLTSPYVFKIAKSFLVWLLDLLYCMIAEWNNAHSTILSSSSSASESQALLQQSQHVDYGTSKKKQELVEPNASHSQYSNGKPKSAEEGQSGNEHEVAKSLSEEQGVQNFATSLAAENHPASGSRTSSILERQGPAEYQRKYS